MQAEVFHRSGKALTLGLPVVLASASPRRQELLRELIPDFEVVAADIDEDALTVEDPYHTAKDLALAKAKAVLALRPDALIVAGDTVVALSNGDGTFRQLAKPTSEDDACRMLGLLSGRTHVVITGVCIQSKTISRVFANSSMVTFRDLNPEEIRDYVATGEPMDKAGGYACQGGASKFITGIDGSISNVIGLPMEVLGKELAKLHVISTGGGGVSR